MQEVWQFHQNEDNPYTSTVDGWRRSQRVLETGFRVRSSVWFHGANQSSLHLAHIPPRATEHQRVRCVPFRDNIISRSNIMADAEEEKSYPPQDEQQTREGKEAAAALDKVTDVVRFLCVNVWHAAYGFEM